MAAIIFEAAQCSKQYIEILLDPHMDSEGKHYHSLFTKEKSMLRSFKWLSQGPAIKFQSSHLAPDTNSSHYTTLPLL